MKIHCVKQIKKFEREFFDICIIIFRFKDLQYTILIASITTIVGTEMNSTSFWRQKVFLYLDNVIVTNCVSFLFKMTRVYHSTAYILRGTILHSLYTNISSAKRAFQKCFHFFSYHQSVLAQEKTT